MYQEVAEGVIKERFGFDDAVGDVGAAVEGDVKSTEPTFKPDKKTPDRKGAAHKGAKGDIPMLVGLEPGSRKRQLCSKPRTPKRALN